MSASRQDRQLVRVFRSAVLRAVRDPEFRQLLFRGAGLVVRSGARITDGGLLDPDGPQPLKEQADAIASVLFGVANAVRRNV